MQEGGIALVKPSNRLKGRRSREVRAHGRSCVAARAERDEVPCHLSGAAGLRASLPAGGGFNVGACVRRRWERFF